MSAARARWTRVEARGGGGGPAARSGHAMALLAPTASVLLFGGADGRVFFDDFHVLEPARYAQGELQAQAQEDQGGEAQGDEAQSERGLRWRRLAVSHAPARHASPCVDASQLSTGNSPGRRRSPARVEPPHAGAGRDYHSMHYVPESAAEETARGLRVLVVGNVVVAAGAGAGAGDALAFEMAELRVEEARVRQATLEAQWLPRRVDSMWKPRARHAHSSAVSVCRPWLVSAAALTPGLRSSSTASSSSSSAARRPPPAPSSTTCSTSTRRLTSGGDRPSRGPRRPRARSRVWQPVTRTTSSSSTVELTEKKPSARCLSLMSRSVGGTHLQVEE